MLGPNNQNSERGIETQQQKADLAARFDVRTTRIPSGELKQFVALVGYHRVFQESEQPEFRAGN